MSDMTHDELKAEYARLKKAYNLVAGAGFRAWELMTTDPVTPDDIEEAREKLETMHEYMTRYTNHEDVEGPRTSGVVFWDGVNLTDTIRGGDE
jgi:hypothetical protein